MKGVREGPAWVLLMAVVFRASAKQEFWWGPGMGLW